MLPWDQIVTHLVLPTLSDCMAVNSFRSAGPALDHSIDIPLEFALQLLCAMLEDSNIATARLPPLPAPVAPMKASIPTGEGHEPCRPHQVEQVQVTVTVPHVATASYQSRLREGHSSTEGPPLIASTTACLATSINDVKTGCHMVDPNAAAVTADCSTQTQEHADAAPVAINCGTFDGVGLFLAVCWQLDRRLAPLHANTELTVKAAHLMHAVVVEQLQTDPCHQVCPCPFVYAASFSRGSAQRHIHGHADSPAICLHR
jgi:hypothetical protein